MAGPSDRVVRFVLKPIAFFASLGPLAWLIWALLTGHLSANPLSDITNETGTWALRFLCIALAVTPLRRLTGWNVVIRFRRMAGLFAFFYGTTHLVIYLVLDRLAGLGVFGGLIGWSTIGEFLRSVGSDIYERPFITIGFTAWVCMLPLALTSTAGMIRRLGGRRWQLLHRLAYAAAIAGVIHYWWLVKADLRRPQAYALVVGGLLTFRLIKTTRYAIWRS
jgi:sulfoxide reductase heme-binding subunit YedZ